MSKISAKGKKRIKTRLKYTKEADEYKRLCVILAWDRGREAVEIADFLSLPEPTVYRYIREYIKNSKIHHDPKGGSTSKLSEEQEDELVDHLKGTARTPDGESDLARKIEAQGGKRGTSRQDLSPTCLFKRTSIL